MVNKNSENVALLNVERNAAGRQIALWQGEWRRVNEFSGSHARNDSSAREEENLG
jgi:hypothetical protein